MHHKELMLTSADLEETVGRNLRKGSHNNSWCPIGNHLEEQNSGCFLWITKYTCDLSHFSTTQSAHLLPHPGISKQSNFPVNTHKTWIQPGFLQSSLALSAHNAGVSSNPSCHAGYHHSQHMASCSLHTLQGEKRYEKDFMHCFV